MKKFGGSLILTMVSALCAGLILSAQADPMTDRLPAPVGDETFEGGFACLAPSSAHDTAPIVCQSDINPSLPSFDFSLVWHRDASSKTRRLDRINVRRSGESEPFQTLEPITSDLPLKIANNGFEALDLNFDGYLDIRVIQFAPAGPNTPYQNWLWSPTAGKFVANPALDKITSPQFDADDQEIISHWRASAAEQGSDIYAYDGTTPVLVHRETDTYGANGVCVRAFYDQIEDELRKTGTGACDASD